MKISVIIPTKNRPDLLKTTLNSVLKQTKKPFEIIIIDGSNDISTLLKTKNLALKNGFKYERQNFNKFKGVAGARNQGALLAQGTYLSFLDDDDTWFEEYLENIYLEIKKGFNVICTGILKKKNGTIVKYKIPPKIILRNDLLVRNPGVQGSNITVKKTFYIEVNGFDDNCFSHIFEDSDFMLKALKSDNLKYKSIQSYLVIYLSHSGNRLSMTKTTLQKKGIINFYKKYKNEMDNSQKDKFIQRALKLWDVIISK